MKKQINTNELELIIPNAQQRKLWDKLVMESENGNVYSLSWYLDCVTNNSWGLITNKTITTGLPIAFKKRTGYKNVFQPFYTMYFDVINPIGVIEKYLKIVANEFNHFHITTQSKSIGLNVNERIRQEMVLENGFEKKYSENARREIKKAGKHNLEFGFHENAKEVVSIFKNNKGADLKEYKKADFARLGQLIDVCIKHKHGFCAHVKYEDQILASGFFITYKNRIIFLKGGITDLGKKSGAMYYLMDGVFRKKLEIRNQKSEIQSPESNISSLTSNVSRLIFDFGGSNSKNVGDFYRKLGGKNISYNEIVIDKRNLFHKVMGKLKK